MPDGTQELAPTFDQGQAMGATLSDKQRQTFSTNDYYKYLEGSFYDGVDNILTPKAFEIAAKRYPKAASIWQERLARITTEQIDKIFDRIPRHRITPTAENFAKQVINDGRKQILSLRLSAGRALSQKSRSLADLNEPEVEAYISRPTEGLLYELDNDSDATKLTQIDSNDLSNEDELSL